MKAINAIDFYKADHRNQYPLGTELVYSNFTPRSDRLAPVNKDDFNGKIVVFGIQAVIQHFLIDQFNDSFFSQPKDEVLAHYKKRMDTSLGEGAITIEHIAALHDLGYLPIHIKALPEGTLSPMKVPVLTMYNTLPEFFWLTNYLESVLSAYLWKPMTTATIANEYRKLLTYYAIKTGSPVEAVMFQGHDFSFRGMSGLEDAMLSGMGHLTSFCGTDTVPAIDAVEYFYNTCSSKEMIGASVPATEHSVMCMGTKEDEIGTFERLLEMYPTGIVSIVSDTWDFWKVINEYAPALESKIRARKDITDAEGNVIVPGKTVFRPDSGDPVKVLCGYAFDNRSYENEEQVYDAYDHSLKTLPEVVNVNDEWRQLMSSSDGKVSLGTKVLSDSEVKGAVECLWEHFGGTLTDEGYKMLDSSVGLIYGDSITLERAKAILQRLEQKGFASTNVVFGIGSFTYQYLTRDSFGFAMKATFGVVEGRDREIFKDPVTDNGIKKSARGLLRVKNGKVYDQQSREQERQGDLKTVFLDGQTWNTQTFSEIRERIRLD